MNNSCKNRQHPELVEKLVAGISNLTSSEEWRSYLDFQSRFYRYSYRNTLLIAAQRRNATQVAGYRAWHKLNRYVLKGEEAIWILAPVVYKKAACRDGDNVEERESLTSIYAFKWVPVFDISQTGGDAPPSVCNRIDGNGVEGYYDLLIGLAGSIGFEVVEHEFGGSANGDCCHAKHRIRIETNNSPAQRVKTLAHELAHALLHEACDNRSIAELEAESTAYIVCQTLGIDSGNYSFGYCAGWAGGGEQAIAVIKASCEHIQRTAATILGVFDTLISGEQAA
jgi:antirestriction protein ArdC